MKLNIDMHDASHITYAMLEDSLQVLQQGSNIPIWFLDQEKDNQAKEHLIHCLKVVSDWYNSNPKTKHFDYNV